jgi:hypothetical protein
MCSSIFEMGLAIIALHGGELAATNAEGGCSYVRFSLPVIAKDRQ